MTIVNAIRSRSSTCQSPWADKFLIVSDETTETPIPEFPGLSESHPSVNSDRQRFVTDALSEVLRGGAKGSRGIIVESIRGLEDRVIHRFDDSKGIRCWRLPHPHPAFSHDGRRLYFNVSATEWTRLHVVELEVNA